MKFTLGWLKEHLDTNASLDEILVTLTQIGLEVEGVEDNAAKYAAFKVAYVETAEQHPDADRLQVLSVKTETESLQVVCGAPNARAGMKGIFAPAGTYVPGLDIKLKKSKIRGVESNGMMASEKEMCLSDEHKGIIEVDDKWDIGTPMSEIYGLNDPVIDIAITPNRADCAGIRGIARDLAVAGLGTLKPLNDQAVQGTFDSSINVSLGDTKSHACHLFLGRIIKGVKNVQSPDWMQARLKAVGLRPISALVDITNYVCLDLCRPLHVYDTAKLNGDIHVRPAKDGEELEALNDKSYTLQDGMTAICDDSGVLALGGIVGGVPSGCTETTTDVFVEAAYFEPLMIARTGRTLQIESDARYRFERGVEPCFTHNGMEVATRLITEICGGDVSNVVVAGKAPSVSRTIAFDTNNTKRLGGIDVTPEEQAKILTSLGFEVSGSGNNISVKTPEWRGDVEGQADLVEEILRIYGYDNVPVSSMLKTHISTHVALSTEHALRNKARQALAGRGMNDSVNWSFIPPRDAELFGTRTEEQTAALTLSNPISMDMGVMRPSLLPTMVRAAARNTAKGYADNAIFEVGAVFEGTDYADEIQVAGGVRSGNAVPRHWAEDVRAPDAYDAKADVLAVLASCGFDGSKAQITTDAPSWYHPGRSGVIRLGKNVLAHFGELHPAICEEMDIDGTVVGFEVFLKNIPQARKKSQARPLLKMHSLQPVTRDFAFIVEEKVDSANIVRTVTGAEKQLIASVNVFDIYIGKGVEDGKKSVALTVTLQPTEKTLTDKEIDAVSDKITNAVAAKVGGTLRG